VTRRQPVAEIGAEDYRIVRHTHDVDLATRLMRAEELRAYGCPGDGWNYCEDLRNPDCPHARVFGKPVPVWVRIIPALPNSWAASEGLHYTYNPAKPHTRGAFKAVEFR
jgi:hypothetical protein